MLEGNGRRIRRKLMAWYEPYGRHELPWRLTRDPYAILVSEVMLQQTQVERVLPYWAAWLERWPAFQDLAAASPADVITAWAGLGYNRRAIALRRAATAVVQVGRMPKSVDSLCLLPGIGQYTASAVACFAFGARVPVVDTNIARVLARAVLGVEGAKAAGPRAIEKAALLLLPARLARAHNLALMDLGATVCTARAPRCTECPLQRECAWLRDGSPRVVQRTEAQSRSFESTSRFARGRIVDVLRTVPSATLFELTAVLPELHRPGTAQYLEALRRDGLVEFNGYAWRLPS